MAASATALWLDSFFAGYDHFFLKLLHGMAEKMGTVMTPLMRAITFLGEKGIIFFLLALVLMLMADRRDLGVCIFGAVCCGALITNIILKDAVARPRPFITNAEYEAWWGFVGAPLEDDFSFPSGHVTACAAAMTAITLMRGRKWLVPSVVIVLLMGISRNYMMAHYPSDVLVAAIIGVFSGFVAWFITQFIFNQLRKRRRSAPIFATILDFDIRDVLPFNMPFAAGKSGAEKRTASGRHETRGGRRAAGPSEGPAETPPKAPVEGDEDVKTYEGPAPRREDEPKEESAEDPGKEAGEDAGEDVARPMSRRAIQAERQAQKKTTARSAQGASRGRHALPAAEKKSSPVLGSLGASGKKGRHEMDVPKRLGFGGKTGRHELSRPGRTAPEA